MIEINYNCPETWDLFCKGYTKSIFQCESKLVQSWLQQIQPRNIWELSAVIAAVRPGCLAGGYTKKLSDCKNGKTNIESLGNADIDNVLSTTWGVLLYQENLLALANRIAWKDLPEIDREIKADNLRKAVGKKDQAKILAIGTEFKDGCVKNGVDKELAETLFSIIQDCGRYLFNLSHSIDYAHVAYETAYRKVHYPLQSLATNLTYAEFKNARKKLPGEELSGQYQEINEIIRESQKLGVNILPPNINSKNKNFAIDGESIRYGLGHIKGFVSRDLDILAKIDKISNFAQFIVLCNTDIHGHFLNKKTIRSLILSGAFSDLQISRKTLLNSQELIENLTEREINHIIDNIDEIQTPSDLKKFVSLSVAGIANKKRKDVITSWATLYNENEFDHPSFIEEHERQLLGIPLTASSADMKDNTRYDKCADCYDEVPEKTIKEVLVVIQSVKLTTIKNGKNAGKTMAKLSVYDSSGSLEIPIFSELYEACSNILIQKNIVGINLIKGTKGWLANGIHQA